MAKILIVTVGGSCEPIVNAIRSDEYDKVFFVCSKGGRAGSESQVDGQGRPCRTGKDHEEARPSIVGQAGLEEGQYEKWVLSHEVIDDLDRCYTEIKRRCARLLEESPDAEVVANFTGGTKTMSAALILVAIGHGFQLTLNQGIRRDCNRVTSGDVAVPIQVNAIMEDRYLSLVENAFDARDYSMARSVASEFLRRNKNPDARRRWVVLHGLAQGFSLWDRFLYAEALDVLENVPQFCGRYLGFLRGLSAHDRPGHGYLVVFDLVNNARRRAGQGRFDDAVARLYRATELMAQARLKERFGWESGAVPIDGLKSRLSPEQLSSFANMVTEDGTLQLGLHNTYQLLFMLGDGVGSLFMEQESRLLNALKARNLSFLAHGFEPIGEAGYNHVAEVIQGFLSDASRVACPDLSMPEQLPDSAMLRAVVPAG